jgi:hypothetical protein
MEELMTVERWSDPMVRAKFYSGFTDCFTLVDTTPRDDIADIHTPEQENRSSC